MIILVNSSKTMINSCFENNCDYKVTFLKSHFKRSEDGSKFSSTLPHLIKMNQQAP